MLSYVPGDVGNRMETAMATLSDPDAEHMAKHSLSEPDLDPEHIAEHTVSVPPHDPEQMPEHSVAVADPEKMEEHTVAVPDPERMVEHTVASSTRGETLDTGRRNSSFTPSFPVSYIWVSL